MGLLLDSVVVIRPESGSCSVGIRMSTRPIGGPTPRSVPYIIAMEACERFSYYGLVAILMLYLKNELRLGGDHAKEVVHLFKTGVYFLPLLGGFLADHFLGRYRTILVLSVFYCLGHGWIALTDASRDGLYVGLALIALGAGGIKPCVSAFVGDQFTGLSAAGLERVYGLFYAAINFGAMFGFGLIPWVRDHHGHGWAFGIPGIFMGIAAAVFWAGSRHYTRIPVQISPATVPTAGAGVGTGLAAVARIALVLAPVPVFWALFDQINTSWVVQGERMTPFEVLGDRFDAERIQSVSALLVLIWVPVLTFGVYPWLDRRGWRIPALARMAAGMGFAALSFVLCAALQHRIEGGATLTLAWQLVPYTVLELGEVLLSATGLEFAYAQGPARHRSLVMSLWLLCTALGNFLVAVITRINSAWVHASGTAEFLFYALLMTIAMGTFIVIARRHHATTVSTTGP
jgi:POT family proton-dependent oligopeptide transporter